MMKDENVIVLDFLPHGKPGDRKAEPVAQVIGEKYFNLLEIIIKDEIQTRAGDKIYIGGDKREKVKYIRGRIRYDDLTNFAKREVENVVNNLINDDEKRFVNFFNIAGPITTRLHSLELLPGIGKKHMWDIIKQRKIKTFESFDELQKRITMLPNPKKIIRRRIIDELEEKDRYRLIVGTGRI